MQQLLLPCYFLQYYISRNENPQQNTPSPLATHVIIIIGTNNILKGKDQYLKHNFTSLFCITHRVKPSEKIILFSFPTSFFPIMKYRPHKILSIRAFNPFHFTFTTSEVTFVKDVGNYVGQHRVFERRIVFLNLRQLQNLFNPITLNVCLTETFLLLLYPWSKEWNSNPIFSPPPSPPAYTFLLNRLNMFYLNQPFCF